jgi:hypothetical protein
MTLLIACSLFLHAAAESPIEVLNAYVFPENVCKVLVRNRGEEPLDLREPEMRREAEDGPLALWTMAEPDMPAPGETAWITALFTLPLPAKGEIPLRLRVAGSETPFSAQAGPRLAVTYSVLAPEEEKAYVFVFNSGAESCTVAAADINDVAIALARPVEIPARGSALLYGKCPLRPSGEFEVPPVIVRLTPADGPPVQIFSRLFRPEHTVMTNAGAAPDAIECLSHAYDGDRDAAAKAIAAAAAKRPTLRTIKFCNVDVVANAAAKFAQIMERNHIEPQLAYSSECASAEYARTLLGSVEATRRATQPGIAYAWVFPSDIHAPSSRPYGVARLRTMIYAMLAGGSKGFELFPPKYQDASGTHARANERLLAELAPLRPLIALSEPVDLLESGEPGGYVVRTLVCGDKGILLFVLPLIDNVAHEGHERLRIRGPGYDLSEEALEIASGNSFPVTRADPRHYEFDLPLASQAQLYLISAR